MRPGLREGTGALRLLQYGTLCLAVATGCDRTGRDRASGMVTGDTTAHVLPGIDILLRDSMRLVRGRRIGLITNQTGLLADGTSTIDALDRAPDVNLVAILAPEHGVRGSAQAGVALTDSIDASTGLPIRSLYGETREPMPAMIEDIDVLVFDIQDIGTRYYTYLSTMALAMRAAGRAGRSFIVLDRPDPVGGETINGNVLDPAFSSFVGMWPVPMRHGLTPAEFALLIRGEFGVEVDLHVVPMRGWHRSMWFDSTGLQWVAPSPNMPDLESATHYPGTCLFEGTNLSVGRGTPLAFQQIGAPWLDAAAVIGSLDPQALPGVRIDAAEFTPASPGDGKYDGVRVSGLRFTTTDRATYDPVRTAIAVLAAIRSTHSRFEFNAAAFDRLAGTDRLRSEIESGRDAQAITQAWAADLRTFATLREPYLLYR